MGDGGSKPISGVGVVRRQRSLDLGNPDVERRPSDVPERPSDGEKTGRPGQFAFKGARELAALRQEKLREAQAHQRAGRLGPEGLLGEIDAGRGHEVVTSGVPEPMRREMHELAQRAAALRPGRAAIRATGDLNTIAALVGGYRPNEPRPPGSDRQLIAELDALILAPMTPAEAKSTMREIQKMGLLEVATAADADVALAMTFDALLKKLDKSF